MALSSSSSSLAHWDLRPKLRPILRARTLQMKARWPQSMAISHWPIPHAARGLYDVPVEGSETRSRAWDGMSDIDIGAKTSASTSIRIEGGGSAQRVLSLFARSACGALEKNGCNISREAFGISLGPRLKQSFKKTSPSREKCSGIGGVP